MFKTLEIENFRAFRRLTMTGLERVNLLVGKNNCGKSTVLESLRWLVADQHPGSLPRIAVGRRPYGRFVTNGSGGKKIPAYDLFHGYALERDSSFRIAASSSEADSPDDELRVHVAPIDEAVTAGAWDPQLIDVQTDSQLVWKWRHHGQTARKSTILSVGGFIPLHPFWIGAPMMVKSAEPPQSSVIFVPCEGLSLPQQNGMWKSHVAARPNRKQMILNLMRTLDSRIQDIDLPPVETDYGEGERVDEFGVDFLVAQQGQSDPQPLADLGEGARRLLGIALAILGAENGLALIDEIDTGLHYSVLRSLWNFVIDLAEELNVQVFATTHSYDCWTALADTADSRIEAGKEPSVSMSRLQAGYDRNVLYTRETLRAAAEIGSEVR